MRTDPPGSRLTQRNREPRHVIALMYETGSVYCTSRTGMTNVPGAAIYGVIEDISSFSQELFPIEGRATIGGCTFQVIDKGGALTAQLRDQLLNFGRGVRGKEVRIYTGDSDDFNELVRVETFVIDDAVEIFESGYEFSCSDRTREMRAAAFQQVGTRLAVTSDPADPELIVLSTAGFFRVQHWPSASDAPNEKVGYVRLRKTGEIIRYTGTTADRFTGLTRGIRNTDSLRIEVTETDDSKKPEVEEWIYLEGPGPAILYALQTGIILATGGFPSGEVLPDLWHLGIDPANIDLDSYLTIGSDLFDPNDFSVGLVLRFEFLEKTDGKRFIEEQLHRAMFTFGPVDTLGRIKLRRLSPVISTSGYVATIDHSNVLSSVRSSYAQADVVNQVSVDYNYDGETYTRNHVLFNTASMQTHGLGDVRSVELAGLYVGKQGSATIKRLFDSYVDRYGAPPIELELEVSCVLNAVEIGDCVRVMLPSVADYTGDGTLDRIFEVQGRTWNAVSGALSLKLFGSTARWEPDVLDFTSTPLDDSWYSSEGTDLASVLTISGGHITANGTLVGSDDLRNSIWYYLGDLTLDAGKTLNIDDNVQLRVRGQLTVNGTINGAGRGLSGIANPDTVNTTPIAYWTWPSYGAVYVTGTFGSTRGSEGVGYIHVGAQTPVYESEGGPVTQGLAPTVPRFALSVVDGVLLGIPSELRGTAGVWGSNTIEFTGAARTVRAKGGDGGAGGSGLFVVCRGLVHGGSGVINLSGASGGAPNAYVAGGHNTYSGAGGGGAPGALYVVLDGSDLDAPDLANGAFLANHGATPRIGNPIQYLVSGTSGPAEPWTGWDPGLGTFDHWESMHGWQILQRDPLGDSEEDSVPTPDGLYGIGDDAGATMRWNLPPASTFDLIELFQSIDNDLANAVRIFKGVADSFYVGSAARVTNYFWVRARRKSLTSSYFPADPNGGVAVTFGGSSVGFSPVMSADVRRSGLDFSKATTAASAWDTGFYSEESYDACSLNVRAGETNTYRMFGLSSQQDYDYTTIDHAIYLRNDGSIEIYENNVVAATFAGPYQQGDPFWINFNGQYVEYYWGVERLRQVPRMGARMYLVAAFFTPGASILAVRFSPTGKWAGVPYETRDEFAYLTTEEFDYNWKHVEGGGEIIFRTDAVGTSANTAVQLGNGSGDDEVWRYRDQLMPFDPNQLYEVGCVVAKHSGASAQFYFGVEGVAADGVTMVNRTGADSHGSQHYCTVKGSVLPDDDTFHIYRGYVKGHGSPADLAYNDPSSPMPMKTGTAFIRLLMIANYPATAGYVVVGLAWLRAVPGALSPLNTVDTAQIDPNAVTDRASVVVTNVEVTAQQHTPDLDGFNTQIANVNYTPETTGNILLTANGSFSDLVGASPTLGFTSFRWKIGVTGDYVASTEFFRSGVAEDDEFRDVLFVQGQMAVTAGVSYNIKLMGAKLNANDTVTVTSAELIVSEAKR